MPDLPADLAAPLTAPLRYSRRSRRPALTWASPSDVRPTAEWTVRRRALLDEARLGARTVEARPWGDESSCTAVVLP